MGSPLRCLLCKSSPATANFKDRVTWFDVQRIEHTVVFSQLRIRQRLPVSLIRVLMVAKQGARVRHGFIKPKLVKAVAEVVVGHDIAFAAALCVGT